MSNEMHQPRSQIGSPLLLLVTTLAGCSGEVEQQSSPTNLAEGPEATTPVVPGLPGAAPGGAQPSDPATPSVGTAPNAASDPTSGASAVPVDPNDPNAVEPGDPATEPTAPADPATGQQDPTTSEPLPSSPEGVAAACAEQGGAPDVGLTKLRRLTRAQFDNTVRDLLGVTGNPAGALAPDERMGPFNSNANAPITDLLVEQHQEVAKRIAAEAATRMSEIAPCDLAAGGSCVDRFVTEFGLRAYRRPLTDEERQQYSTLYALGAQGGDASNAFRLVVEAFLQSPFFLYHHDVGSTGAPQAEPVAVTGYELASRLSYFLWNSMPDDTLFALAGDQSLLEDAVLSAQAERMLQDDKAADAIPLFHQQWLGIEALPERTKDTSLFPTYGDDMVQAMQRETFAFSDHVVRRGDGLLGTLLTANYSFVEGPLFELYGVAEPAGFTPGTTVDLDPAQRAGILTHASVLASHAHRDQTSPVHRGILIRENLLCQIIPPPPADVVVSPPPPSTSTTTRERFAQHVADPSCSSCHALMDPLGLGFENYDAIGAYRTTEGSNPVDASGEFLGTSADLSGTFDGGVELATRLAGSSDVSGCVAKQWFRFSLGRIESLNDACTVRAIQEGFTASGGNIRTLLTQIVRSHAFRNVRAAGGSEETL